MWMPNKFGRLAMPLISENMWVKRGRFLWMDVKV